MDYLRPDQLAHLAARYLGDPPADFEESPAGHYADACDAIRDLLAEVDRLHRLAGRRHTMVDQVLQIAKNKQDEIAALHVMTARRSRALTTVLAAIALLGGADEAEILDTYGIGPVEIPGVHVEAARIRQLLAGLGVPVVGEGAGS